MLTKGRHWYKLHVMISADLKHKLISLAEKYEKPEFLKKDPSQFMHRYSDPVQQELVAFLAANMAFGQRAQILSHVQEILSAMGTEPSVWVQNEGYRKFFTKGGSSFYRMYTHTDFILFFDVIKNILRNNASLGEYFRSLYLKQNTVPMQSVQSGQQRQETGLDTVNLSPYTATIQKEKLHLSQLICSCFPKECGLIPHSDTTAAKKLNMFLRWMIRDNSPVDLGLWSSWYSKKDLLMPLDTHVMQQSTNLGILAPSSSGKPKSATIKTCMELTQIMGTVFPGDPVRADYALFGLGVDNSQSN